MTEIIDTAMQSQMDCQLLEQGAFTPLELLISSGRLMYSDYESWRNAEVEYLDELFLGNPERIREQIEQAVQYARRIGLVEEEQAFYPWGQVEENQNKPLRISADKELHALICRRYTSPQDLPQMDMFFDNPVAALTNGIVAALANRNLPEAQRQLDQLYTQAPNHADLAAFDKLCNALQQLDRPIDSQVSDQVEAHLEFLLTINPIAKRLLGVQSRDFLVPLWRQLAAALNGYPFKAGSPRLHASYALGYAEDWQGVSEAVLNEADWWRSEPLCLRLAEAGFRRQNRAQTLTAWCHLCWNPEADETLELLEKGDQPDPDVDRLWQMFLDTEDELALNGPLSVTDFPAWLLLTEPGLVHQLSIDLPVSDSAGEEHYRLVHQLVRARRAKDQAEELALRQKLQEGSLGLFLYLKSRLKAEGG